METAPDLGSRGSGVESLPERQVMKKSKVAILGGGIAGMAAGYYLSRHNIDVVIFESQETPGGNCRTIEKNGFFFDTGAHRIHDKNQIITRELQAILGKSMVKVQAPSMIFDNNRLLNFPIQTVDIFTKMSIDFALLAGLSLVKARLFSRKPNSFEDFAVNAYGKLMSERFLLNYSSKLWGVSCDEISQDIAGERLKGINLLTILKSFISKKASRKAHYEGDFFYPAGGIQRISEKLVSIIGYDKVLTSKRVTGIHGNNGNITQIEINNHETVAADIVVSTLPLPDLLSIMKHDVPEPVLNVSSSLRFRNIRLAAFSLNRDSVNNCATMYFPDRKYIFTRLYEPKNRCRDMSPDGKTMLVAEVPCFSDDEVWQAAEQEFIDIVRAQILETGMTEETEIISSCSERMDKAYPILENGYREKVEPVMGYLSSFQNLYLSGRNGLFRYSWIHDMFNDGRIIADKILEAPST
jgi:protoporphyrinogen oxidase